MKNASLRRELTFKVTLLLLVTLALSWILFRTLTKENLTDEFLHRARTDSQLLLMTNQPLKAAETLKQEGWRVTFLSPEGQVLSDSAADAPSLDNHLGRPEVQQALKQGEGHSRRYSRSLNAETLYYVQSLPDGRLLRLSMPMRGLEKALEQSNLVFLGFSVLTGLAGALLIGIITRRGLRPLNELAAQADRIDPEGRKPLFVTTGDPDLRRLAAALTGLMERVRKHSEGLQNQQDRLKNLLETLPVGVLFVQNHRVVRSNDEALRLLDLPPTEPLLVGQLPAALGSLIAQLDETEGVKSCSLSLAPDRPLDVRAKQTRGGLLLALADASPMMRLAAMKRQFITDATHQFGTPLTTILLTADLLLQSPREEDRADLERLQNAARRLSSLVDRLVMLSRMENAPTAFAKESFAADELAKDALELCAVSPMADHLDLELDVEPCSLQANRADLMTALTNLLDNAVKYTHSRWKNAPGGKVKLTGGREEGGYAFKIQDNGPGWPNEGEALFSRFRRGKATENRVPGQGLGLAIAKEVAHRHDGTLTLDPVQDGAQIRLWLPLP